MATKTPSIDPQTRATTVLLVLLGVVVVVSNIAVELWQRWHGIPAVTRNPFGVFFNLLAGKYSGGEEPGVFVFLIGLVVLLAVVAVLLALTVGRRWLRGRKRGDEAAKLAGAGSDIRSLTEGAVREKARRLAVVEGFFGLPIGITIRAKQWLWSSVEDVCVMIAGPRTGKSTSWVVPRIFAAKGAVVTTSNKRDVVDVTRLRRQDRGEQTWVFDPQGIAEEPQNWWWNILTYVEDAISARALAQIFVDSQRDANARTDAFFDGKALDLITALLLAARKLNRDLMALHTWVNDYDDDEPVKALHAAGEIAMAETLRGIQQMPVETKGGVYGGAAQTLNFLLNEKAMRWVLPSPGLIEFDPSHFVRTKETLYCLSQEGRGSASPIVTALTVAVTEAAVKYATSLPGGRLSTPMTIILDEAANVCRWRELPDLYSHFGSRGILVDTILQSWSQGVAIWGEEGMRKLWSAANIKVYGGGVSERDFLSQLSDLIGVQYQDSVQDSYGPGGSSRSVSRLAQQRPIADVAELASLPAGRAWVLSSGNRPVLVGLVPYWELAA